MIAIQRVGSMLLISFLLAACGSAAEPPPPPPVEETVFRDIAVTPLEKAKKVENVVMEQKRATDRAVEQNESDQ
jgi:hypothetical protein